MLETPISLASPRDLQDSTEERSVSTGSSGGEGMGRTSSPGLVDGDVDGRDLSSRSSIPPLQDEGESVRSLETSVIPEHQCTFGRGTHLWGVSHTGVHVLERNGETGGEEKA